MNYNFEMEASIWAMLKRLDVPPLVIPVVLLKKLQKKQPTSG